MLLIVTFLACVSCTLSLEVFNLLERFHIMQNSLNTSVVNQYVSEMSKVHPLHISLAPLFRVFGTVNHARLPLETGTKITI